MYLKCCQLPLFDRAFPGRSTKSNNGACRVVSVPQTNGGPVLLPARGYGTRHGKQCR